MPHLLGGVSFTTIPTSSLQGSDLNNLSPYTKVVVSTATSVLNMPPLPTDADIFVCCAALGGGLMVQFGGRHAGGNSNVGYWYRCKHGGTIWGDWLRLDNFGCNTLAELKAALAKV